MNHITKMLIDMAKFYQYDLAERQLEMYVEVMSTFPIELVLACGKEYVQNPKNDRFPIPPHKIMAKYLPQELDSKDVGREVALRIREAVSNFGWPRPGDAAAFIGPAGWRIVQQMGGWTHICENLGTEIQETTFMAQCRDAVESAHRLQKQGFDPGRPAIEQGNKSGVLEKADFAKLLPEKK